jgi:protein pelota
MRIINFDEKSGEMVLKIEDEDDLWLLHNIIDRDDEVYARTTREIDMGNKSVRKSMYIGIKVDKVEFQPFTNRLRIHGTIIYHPEKYEEYGFLGSHHTINVKVSDEIKIKKSKWQKYIIKQIERSCGKSEKVLIISIDDEEAAAGVLRSYGLEIIFEMQLKIPGKREIEAREEKVNKELREISKKIMEIIERRDVEILVISGISYMREKLTEKILEDIKGLKKKPKIISEDTSNGGVRGLYETIKRESIIKALEKIKMIEDNKIVGEYLQTLIKEPSMAIYGLNDVYNASKLGIIKTLLISNRKLKTYDEEKEKIEEVIENVEKYNGEIRIISDESEAGRELNSIGGIAAILRYKMETPLKNVNTNIKS